MKKFKFTHSSFKESLGLASHLSEKATIFYHQVSHSTHLGSVTDLICARIKDSQVQELRLRVLLNILFFNLVHYVQNLEKDQPRGSRLNLFSFECGVDAEKFGISVGFQLPPGTVFALEEAQKALQEAHFTVPFYDLIHKATLFSDKIVVKIHPTEKRCEVILFLARPELEYEELEGKGVELEWLDLSGELKSAATPHEYVELGDLEHDKFLKEEDEEESEFIKKFKGTENIKDELIRIKSSNPEMDEMITRITGGGIDPEKMTSSQQLKLYIEMIKELQNKLNVSKEALDKVQIKVQETKPSGGGGVFGLFKKSLPLLGGSTPSSNTTTLRAFAEIEESVKTAFEKNKPKVLTEAIQMISIQEELLKNLQNHGIYELLKSKHNTILSIKEVVSNAETIQFLNTFFEDLLSQRYMLLELFLAIQPYLKEGAGDQKEGDKKLQDQLKQKDEVIKNKTTAIANLKEQINQLTINAERLKNSSKSSIAEGGFKKKLEMQEKVNEHLKKDNARLSGKMDELTKEVNKYKQNSRNQTSQDGDKIQAELTKAQQEIQKLKKENQDISGKVKASERLVEPVNRQLKEAKNQMQKASQMLAQKKKEIEDIKSKNLQLERDKNKYMTELEALKSQNAKNSGTPSSGGGQAA